LLISVACLRMCVLFYVYFVCLHVCACAFKSRFHCRRAFETGASGLPYYCTSIYVHSWCNCTQWGWLWDHPHKQHFAYSPPVSRLITFPPTSWLLLTWQASPPGTVKSQRRRGPSRDIKTGQATHLWDPDGAVGELGGQWRIIAIIGLHYLSEIGTLSQNRCWFWRRTLAQLLYLGVSPFCTRSRGLVLKPQSPPHRVNWCASCVDSKPKKKKSSSQETFSSFNQNSGYSQGKEYDYRVNPSKIPNLERKRDQCDASTKIVGLSERKVASKSGYVHNLSKEPRRGCGSVTLTYFLHLMTFELLLKKQKAIRTVWQKSSNTTSIKGVERSQNVTKYHIFFKILGTKLCLPLRWDFSTNYHCLLCLEKNWFQQEISIVVTVISFKSA